MSVESCFAAVLVQAFFPVEGIVAQPALSKKTKTLPFASYILVADSANDGMTAFVWLLLAVCGIPVSAYRRESGLLEYPLQAHGSLLQIFR